MTPLCSWVISHVRLSECKHAQCCSLKTSSWQNVFPRTNHGWCSSTFSSFPQLVAEPYNSEAYRELKVSHDQEWSAIPGLGVSHAFTFNIPAWEHTVWKLVVERLQLLRMGLDRVFLQNRTNTTSLSLHLLPEHRDRNPGTFLDSIIVFRGDDVTS